jgi:hypothetical protein
MEVSSEKEAQGYLEERRNFFVLLDYNLFSQNIFNLLNKQKNYLVFVNNYSQDAVALLSKIGLKRIISYPIYSRKIMNRIGSFA